MDPMIFIEVALILFLSVFISVLVREWLRSRHEVAKMANLPLEEDRLTSLESTVKP